MTASSAGPPSHQTTLLIGGSNGTATLTAILGDKSNARNKNHILRVATRSSTKYLQDSQHNDSSNNNSESISSEQKSPRVWKCVEKQHISDLISADIFPTRKVIHFGSPDSVFVYGNDNESIHSSNNGTLKELSPLEQAISGIGAVDNGGPVDLIVLCCPVSAHLSLLRRIARALYNLNSQNLLNNHKIYPHGLRAGTKYHPNLRKPLLIGTLYGAGGFDWMARIAFATERPQTFQTWTRPLALFALKAFPYLCKSLKVGEVNLHGRFPQLQVAVMPSNVYIRNVAKRLLDRLLQNEVTGKKLEFLGLCGEEEVGGDGSWKMEEELLLNWKIDDASVTDGSTSSTSSLMVHPSHDTDNKNDNDIIHHPPPSPILDLLITRSLSDHADPSSSLAFFTCTLNATNQILHPCILVALFRDTNNPSQSDRDGTIPWNPQSKNRNNNSTPFPRFYADGAAKPEAGRLITSIAGSEMYFVMDAIEQLLSPRGYDTLSALHGGEPLGRRVMNYLGNSPRDLGERSGLTRDCLRREWRNMFVGKTTENSSINYNQNTNNKSIHEKHGHIIHREGLLARLMSYGLSHNARLNAVLSPCIIVSEKPASDGTILIKPDPRTRFFTDDVQHGLCIYLGLAELLGFDLENDMKWTLYVVRRLQRWMGKEFVLPELHTLSLEDKDVNKISADIESGGNVIQHKRMIVSHAKDMAETSAPQAFGVHSISELRQFLKLDVFGELCHDKAQDQLLKSGLVSKL